MTIQQVSIAFAKYITGYRPGDDSWGPEDDQAYNFALYDEAFPEGAKNTEQANQPDGKEPQVISMFYGWLTACNKSQADRPQKEKK